MSFDRYVEFFLNSASNIVKLETLQISHPNFSQTYWIVRNAINGITAKIETVGYPSQAFDYYPVKIEPNDLQDDLDFGYKVEVGELGNVFPIELDNVDNNDAYETKPTVIYRAFRSDDLLPLSGHAVINGPHKLVIKSFTFNKTGVVFDVRAPSVNIHQTGEVYRLDRFPMLRGYL